MSEVPPNNAPSAEGPAPTTPAPASSEPAVRLGSLTGGPNTNNSGGITVNPTAPNNATQAEGTTSNNGVDTVRLTGGNSVAANSTAGQSSDSPLPDTSTQVSGVNNTATAPVGNPNAGKSEVRLVKLQVQTDGTDFLNPISAVVKQHRYSQANTFTVKISLYGDPDHDIKWWGEQARVDKFPMEIIMKCGDPSLGYDGIDSEKIITGEVDKIFLDIRKGVVTCHGRDLFALFAETYTFVDGDSYANHQDITVHDLFRQLASKHNLDIKITANNNPTVYHIYRENGILTGGVQHTRLATEADLVRFLATASNAYVRMNGNTLEVRDFNDIDGIWNVILTPPDPDDGQVVILKPSNATDIVLDRDLNLARNTAVELVYYDADAGPGTDPVRAFSTVQGRPGIHATIRRTTHTFKSKEDLKNRANSIRDEVLRHEKKVHWTEPGDLKVSVVYKMQLTQGDTDWHQSYWIESIERRMDWRGGFEMECIGTASDPASANDEEF